MLIGDAPFGDLPFGDFDLNFSNSISDKFTQLLNNELEREWLVDLFPRDKNSVADPPDLLTVRLSSGGHRSHSTDADVIQFDEALTAPYSITFGLPNLWGFAATSSGSIKINVNTTPVELRDEDWYGRECRIRLGPRGGRQVEFGLVAIMQSISHSYDDTLTSIVLNDYSFLFDRPIQTNRYLGTGDLEGDAQLKGVLRPILLGEEFQIEPVFVSGTIFQMNDGSMEEVVLSSVKVGNRVLVFDVNVADITTATPAANEYATSLSTGYMKLGAFDEQGVLTCRAKGHNSSALGYVDTVSGLIRLLATVYAGLDDPSELDVAAFTALESSTAPMGLYIRGRSRRDVGPKPVDAASKVGVKPTDRLDSPPNVDDRRSTIRDAANVFLQSDAAYAWLKPEKLLTVGRIINPDLATADFALKEEEDDFISWKNDPFESQVYQVFVGYRRYSRQLSQDELEVGPTPAALNDRFDRGEEYRWVDAIDTGILIQNPEARQLTILTALVNSVDAQKFADEQLALRKNGLRIQSVNPKAGLVERGIGDALDLHDDQLPVSPKRMIILKGRNVAAAQGSGDTIVWDCLVNV